MQLKLYLFYAVLSVCALNDKSSVTKLNIPYFIILKNSANLRVFEHKLNEEFLGIVFSKNV
jgi:hypothetical protein